MSIAPTPPSRRPRPTDQADVRRHNAGLVLAAVSDGPVSRAEVAAPHRADPRDRRLDRRRAARGRAGRRAGHASPRGVGRPGTDLALDPVGRRGRRASRSTSTGSPCVVVDLAGAGAPPRLPPGRPARQAGGHGAALGRAPRRRRPAAAAAAGLTVRGIGVAVPGLVDLDASVLRIAPNLGWADVPVLTRMRGRLDVWPGPARSSTTRPTSPPSASCGPATTATTDSFVLVNGDVGVGAGIVLEGRLHRGHARLRRRARAPHRRTRRPRVPLRRPRMPRAGRRSRLDPARCRPASDVRAPGPTPSPTLLGGSGSRRARARSARCEDAGAALGVGIAAIVNLFDVDAVVLGGVYAPLFPWLEAPRPRGRATAGCSRRRWAPISVAPSRLGRDAAVVGAARSALRELLADPLGVVATSA